MSQETVDTAFMMRQMQTGLNTLVKMVSDMDDRLTSVESESHAQASLIAAVSDGYPPHTASSAELGASEENRTFAVRAEDSGEGDGAETEFYVTNCRFMFGRRVVVIEDDFLLPTTSDGDGGEMIADGRYYLVIPHEDPDDAYIADDPGDGNNDMTTVIPLFEYEDGEIVDDYRGLPTIPVYETEEDVDAANENL